MEKLKMRKRKNIKVKYFAPILTDWDRKFMAYHEAGHAVCSYYLPEREPLICVTIDSSSEAFGMIRTEERQHHNETEISFRSMIATFLAGQISEEMFLNCKPTSCIYDLIAARKIATDMVIKFGMGKTLGVTALNIEEFPSISPSLQELICKDIQDIIATAEHDAKKILQNHHTTVEKLAKQLLFCGTLNNTTITDFFDKMQNYEI